MSALAALLLCTLVGSGKVELRFAPAEGSQVRRTITIDQTLAATGHQVLRTLDQYRKVGDGRPLVLQRRFEQLEAGSPFEGTSVVYTWVPEEAAYGKYYDARESSEAALRDLAEDLDLRALLPTGAVAIGEEWSVPAAKLKDVFAPLGHDAARGVFAGESKGECKLKLVSAGEPQSHPLATIELAWKLEAASWTLEGRGTLLWDLVAKRAASFTLRSKQTLPNEGQQHSFACEWRIEDPAAPAQPPSPK